MRILTIFTRHGTEKYTSAESELSELFRLRLPDSHRDVIVVDTAIGPGRAEPGEGRTLIGSDNTFWEFSAIDAAVRALGARLWTYDLVNVATSAFNQLYVAYLDRFRPAVMEAIAGRPVCLGHIDCYNEPVRVREFVSQHWIRTSCFFLPPAELGILGSAVSVRDRARWFSGDPDRPFRDDAPLSSNYKRLIADWLGGLDTGQGVTWHSQIAPEERLALFEQKALAILNEHLLSARLRAAGCQLVDVTWLSSRLTGGGERVEWQTPWWLQISGREVDAVRVNPLAPDAARQIS